MSQPSQISDDPLPDADPVEPLEKAEAVVPESHHDDNKLHLEDPHFGPVSSYGQTDPASLAAVQTHDLPDPSLNPVKTEELTDPHLTKFTPGGEGLAADPPTAAPETPVESAPAGADFSNWDPHLAHLAQVGLTPADHWEEQIKPRIDQLHQDITQVNEQLDDLDKAKPKPK